MVNRETKQRVATENKTRGAKHGTEGTSFPTSEGHSLQGQWQQQRCGPTQVRPQPLPQSLPPPASLRARAFSRRIISCATLKMPPVGCSHTKHFALLALCCSAHCRHHRGWGCGGKEQSGSGERRSRAVVSPGTGKAASICFAGANGCCCSNHSSHAIPALCLPITRPPARRSSACSA